MSVISKISVGGTVYDLSSEADIAQPSITGSTNNTGYTIKETTFFFLNGVLVRAIANIADGETFTENTNYKVETAGGLNALNAEINRGSVSVTADGVKTYSPLLDSLYNLLDLSKLTKDASCIVGTSIFKYENKSSDIVFFRGNSILLNNGTAYETFIALKSSGSIVRTITFNTNNTVTSADSSSTVLGNNTKLTLFY